MDRRDFIAKAGATAGLCFLDHGLLAPTLASAASGAQSQIYPAKPLRLVVPYAAGGSTDVVARLLGQKLSERLGQPVIVENRPGGDGIVAAQAVAKSTPDGYTFLFAGSATMAVLPHTRKDLPYDPFRDFAHVAQAAYAQFVLAVHPSVPAANVRELIALARAKPGTLNYATGSEGGYLAGEIFKAASGTDIVHVPYKGMAPATTDLLAGRVNMMFATFAGIVPYFQSGKLRPLAVSGDARSPALPAVPTMIESGLADCEMSSAWGISGPVGMPGAAIARINEELRAVLDMPEVGAALLAQGIEPRYRDAAQFTAVLRAEWQKRRAALQRIGYKAT